ncbi:MAG TPA: glycosyltransferase [Flavitalea sp.]|nr:glycosyltransferase [Flavitalea sp.]
MSIDISIKDGELISVVIPSYNHGNYLARAIESVLSQTYKHTEIIVVDDGSVDNTKQVAEDFTGVVYVYQHNQGLSAARNKGIDKSKGKYILFLDADDWLHTEAVKKNHDILYHHPEAAFVSGGHIKTNDAGEIIEEVRENISSDHYLHFLQGNYIGMHGTVLYAKWIFDSFRFDTSLRACEDYDLFMKISRKHPVLHHTDIAAYYYIHGSNMSGDIKLMLDSVLLVLNRQESLLKTKEEKKAFVRGRKIWKEYYLSKNTNTSFKMPLKKRIKQLLPKLVQRKLYSIGLINQFIPPVGSIRKGDFNRVTPFSKEFGYDRGGPVDRYYIENFLEQNAPSIKGRILEIGDNEYTLKFGKSEVVKSDILHIDPSNSKATIIGDLSDAPQIADNTYDCIILTQTLHLIYNYMGALQTCFRVLKPGGVLLMTVPGITHIDQGEWKNNWLWAFTSASVKRMIAEVFPKEPEIDTYGNVFIASAFLYGMGVNEVKKQQLDHHDPHYQVIITAKATKTIFP